MQNQTIFYFKGMIEMKTLNNFEDKNCQSKLTGLDISATRTQYICITTKACHDNTFASFIDIYRKICFLFLVHYGRKIKRISNIIPDFLKLSNSFCAKFFQKRENLKQHTGISICERKKYNITIFDDWKTCFLFKNFINNFKKQYL